MAIESPEVKRLPKTEWKLRKNCQASYSTNFSQERKYSYLKEHNGYYQVMFPYADYRTIIGLEVNFNPFDDEYITYCEVDYDSLDGTYVTFFKVKKKTGVFEINEGEFNIDTDVEIIECALITGTKFNNSVWDLFEGILKNKSIDKYINDVRDDNNTLTSPTRYLPNPEDIIDNLPDDEIDKCLVEQYQNLLEGKGKIDPLGLINYDKLIEDNKDILHYKLLKGMVKRILMLPNSIWQYFTNPQEDLNMWQEDIMLCLKYDKHNLKMLSFIKQFQSIAKISSGDNIWNKNNEVSGSKYCDEHYLCLWEIVKCIHKYFYSTYRDIKKTETYSTNGNTVGFDKTIINKNAYANDDYGLDPNFWDDGKSNSGFGSCQLLDDSTRSQVIMQPKSLKLYMNNDYNKNKRPFVITNYKKYKCGYDNLEFIDDNQKNNILSHLDLVVSYDTYLKLQPKSNKRKLIRC